MPGEGTAVLTDGMEIAEIGDRPPTVFLLSPATLQGIRAGQLASPDSRFATARRFRYAEGVPIGEAFAFLSALYFRGKIAYAERFAAPPPGIAGGVFVITPGLGLVPPDWALTRERFEQIKKTPVDVRASAYTRPLAAHARELAGLLPTAGRAVLLGSVATGKYVDILRPVLGERLLFPLSFAGVGDMARGSRLLKAVESGKELEYGTLDQPRHRSDGSHGSRGGEGSAESERDR